VTIGAITPNLEKVMGFLKFGQNAQRIHVGMGLNFPLLFKELIPM
jgi:hypothetical protein